MTENGSGANPNGWSPVSDNQPQRALRMHGAAAPDAAQNAVVLHIAVDTSTFGQYTTDKVWRRLRVPIGMTMTRFGRIVQTVLSLADTAPHAFRQPCHDCEPAADATVMPAGSLERHHASGTPSELLTVGELLAQPGDTLTFLHDFDEPLRATITVHVANVTAGQPSTLLIDGAGDIPAHKGGMPFDIASVNRELDAERWVMETLESTKPGLQDLVLRTGMWELAQLISFVEPGRKAHATKEQRATLVEPLRSALEQAGSGVRIPSDVQAALTAMDLLDDTGAFTPLGAQLHRKPGRLLRHIARKLPLERSGRANDAAWLKLLSLIGLPYGPARILSMEGLAWAGWSNDTDPTTDPAAAREPLPTPLTSTVLRELGIVGEDGLTLGGPLSRTRREFLREVLRMPKKTQVNPLAGGLGADN